MSKTEYPKIPSLWQRSPEGNHEIIPGKFRNETFQYLWDCPWVWTEKLDGTNVRIEWDGHSVAFKGRTDRAQLKTMANGTLQAHLDESYGTPAFESMLEQTFGEKPAVLYGEGIGAKIQRGGGEYGSPRFVMFDACVNGYWLDHIKARRLADELGVPFVGQFFDAPRTLKSTVAWATSVGDIPSSFKIPPAEGLVGQPATPVRFPNGKPIRVKLKVDELGVDA